MSLTAPEKQSYLRLAFLFRVLSLLSFSLSLVLLVSPSWVANHIKSPQHESIWKIGSTNEDVLLDLCRLWGGMFLYIASILITAEPTKQYLKSASAGFGIGAALVALTQYSAEIGFNSLIMSSVAAVLLALSLTFAVAEQPKKEVFEASIFSSSGESEVRQRVAAADPLATVPAPTKEEIKADHFQLHYLARVLSATGLCIGLTFLVTPCWTCSHIAPKLGDTCHSSEMLTFMRLMGVTLGVTSSLLCTWEPTREALISQAGGLALLGWISHLASSTIDPVFINSFLVILLTFAGVFAVASFYAPSGKTFAGISSKVREMSFKFNKEG
jgi:hypothetical protein